jgi:hypothetical protein
VPNTILPNGVTIPYDFTSLPRLVVVSRGRGYRSVDGTMVDEGPAESPRSFIVTGTTYHRGARAAATKRNVALLTEILSDLEAKGFGKVGSVEAPSNVTGAPVKMTVAEFKSAFHKPGTTFHCPAHMKHELEE